jgi:O-antigen/teichoic acid export membrane protein
MTIPFHGWYAAARLRPRSVRFIPSMLLTLAWPATPWSNPIESVMDREGAFLLLSRVLQMGNGFALSLVLIRKFGLAGVGTYTVAAVATAALSWLCSAGLPYSLPREPIRDHERNSVAVLWAVLLLPLAALVAVPFGWLMARRPSEWIEIALFACGGYFFGQINVLNTLLLLQRRIDRMLLVPVVTFAGIVLGFFLSRSMAQFAVILLAARAFGNLTVLAGMKYARVSFSSAVRYGLSGLKYSPMDMIAMLFEQAACLIAAGILPRMELGQYGLCQQLLGAADTPGWAIVQSHYPELVRTPLTISRSLRGRVFLLSFIMAALLSGGGAVLGRYVYKIPGFFAMTALLTLSIPWRYLSNFYDQALRAAGYIRAGTQLAATKLVGGLLIFWMLVSAFGLWGCILASVLISIALATLYRQRALPILNFPSK